MQTPLKTKTPPPVGPRFSSRAVPGPKLCARPPSQRPATTPPALPKANSSISPMLHSAPVTKSFSETYSKRSARLRPKPNSAGPATFSATTSASSLSSRATPTSAPTRSSQARPASSPHSPAASSSLRFRMSSARRSACSATLPISISILMPLGRPNGSTPMATISKNWRNRRVTAFG